MVYKRVNMAEMVISSKEDIFAIHGLGSCLGLTIHDPTRAVGAMAHVMLPCNLTGIASSKPGKYVDTAIDEMINGMKKFGCDQENMVAKMCGGSRMFKASKDNDQCIGAKNIKLATKILKQRNIPIAARDVGGDFGRIVEFDVKTGQMYIKTVAGDRKVI